MMYCVTIEIKLAIASSDGLAARTILGSLRLVLMLNDLFERKPFSFREQSGCFTYAISSIVGSGAT